MSAPDDRDPRWWGRVLPPTLVVVALLVAWEAWVRLRHVPDYVLPPPSRVATTAADSWRLLPGHLGTTLLETVLGLLLGAAAGVAIALLVSGVPLARRSLGPLLVASQTIPMIVLAPLFAIVFGFGLTPKVVIVALVTFFPVAISTVAGLDGAEDELVDLVRALGGGTATVLRVVRLPAAIPSFVAGLRISSAYALAGAVIAEGTGGSQGLGFFITRSQASFRVDRIILAVVVVAVLSGLLYGLVGVLGRLAAPWQRAGSRPLAAPALPSVPRHRPPRGVPVTMPTTRPRLRRSLGVAALLLLVAVGCSGGDDGGAAGASGDGREQVTVVLEWSPNTNHSGVYLAQSEGWYADAGLDVEVVAPGDAGSLQVLGAGKADVAFTVQEELVPARAQGVPVVGLAAVIEHNTSSLLSLTEDGITRPRDLAGHTYGGFGGQLETALVEKMVACDGGDPSAVDFADVGEADYRLGLTRDQYDAVWIFDAWDGIRLGQVEGLDTQTIPFIDHQDCIPDWYTPMLASSEAVIEDRPEVLRTFMDVTARGYREAMADPEAAAAALLDAVPELDPDLVARSAEYLSTRYSEDPAAWGQMDRQRWVDFVAFLVDAGLIDEPIDVDAASTDRFLPAA